MLRKIDSVFKLCDAMRALMDVPGFQDEAALKAAYTVLVEKVTDWRQEHGMSEVEVWQTYLRENHGPVSKRHAKSIAIHDSIKDGHYDVLAPLGWEELDVIEIFERSEAELTAKMIQDHLRGEPTWAYGEALIFDHIGQFVHNNEKAVTLVYPEMRQDAMAAQARKDDYRSDECFGLDA